MEPGFSFENGVLEWPAIKRKHPAPQEMKARHYVAPSYRHFTEYWALKNESIWIYSCKIKS